METPEQPKITISFDDQTWDCEYLMGIAKQTSDKRGTNSSMIVGKMSIEEVLINFSFLVRDAIVSIEEVSGFKGEGLSAISNAFLKGTSMAFDRLDELKDKEEEE